MAMDRSFEDLLREDFPDAAPDAKPPTLETSMDDLMGQFDGGIGPAARDEGVITPVQPQPAPVPPELRPKYPGGQGQGWQGMPKQGLYQEDASFGTALEDVLNSPVSEAVQNFRETMGSPRTGPEGIGPTARRAWDATGIAGLPKFFQRHLEGKGGFPSGPAVDRDEENKRRAAQENDPIKWGRERALTDENKWRLANGLPELTPKDVYGPGGVFENAEELALRNRGDTKAAEAAVTDREAGGDIDGVTRETLLDQYKKWLGETAVREGTGKSLESLPDITNFENYSDYRAFLSGDSKGSRGSAAGKLNKANAMRAFGKTLKGADKDAFDKFRTIDKEASGERKRMQRMLSEPNDAKRSKMAEAEKKKPLETKTQYVLSEQGIQRKSFETALRQHGYTGGKTLGKKPTGSKQRKELLETQAEIAGHLRGERDAKLGRIRTAKLDEINAKGREDAIAEQLRKTETERMGHRMTGYAARLGLRGDIVKAIMDGKATDPATAKRIATMESNIVGFRALDQARDKAMKTLESLASQDPAAAAKLKAFRFQVAYLMEVRGLTTDEWVEPLDDILAGLVPGYRAAHRR